MPYGKSPAKMGHKDSAMKMGHEGSAMKNLNKGYGQQVKSPMKMQGSWMSKHSKSALHMGHSPMKMESIKQEKKNLMQDMPVDDKASAMQMGHSPLEKNETPAERKARLKKENKAELDRLKELTAKRKSKEEADKNKPKVKA